MKRYCANGQSVESAKVDAFLAEVADVCKRHGMSIGHEDRHGSFEVGVFNEDDKKWLLAAIIRNDLFRFGV